MKDASSEAKEEHGPGYLIQLYDPAGQDQAGEVVLGVLGALANADWILEACGIRNTRADGIGADMAIIEVEYPVAGEVADCRLGGRIDAEAGVPDTLMVPACSTSYHDDLVVELACHCRSPLFRPTAVEEKMIGAFTLTMREVEDASISKARLYVDTLAAPHEAGDFVQPIDAGVIAASSVRASLADLCREDTFARTSDSDITCFKSVGCGLADLVAAKLVYQGDQFRRRAPNS